MDLHGVFWEGASWRALREGHRCSRGLDGGEQAQEQGFLGGATASQPDFKHTLLTHPEWQFEVDLEVSSRFSEQIAQVLGHIPPPPADLL